MNIDAIAAHISKERGQWGGLCPDLREALAVIPEVSQGDFVAAAVSLGINKSTAAIQFRKQRAFAAGCDQAEAAGKLDEFLAAHKW